MLEQYSDLLTITELRDVLDIGRSTAYNLLNRGDIPAIRIGKKWKIPKAAVIQYLEQWKKPVTSAN